MYPLLFGINFRRKKKKNSNVMAAPRLGAAVEAILEISDRELESS